MAKFLKKDDFNNNITSYNFLPFKFSDFDKDTKIVSNLIGEYELLPNDVFNDFTSKILSDQNLYYSNLRDKH